jgi:hypothetical protein
MSSSDSLPKTEKYPHEKLTLDGSNYSQWATGFKMWAGSIGLWPYVNGDEKEPSPPATLTDMDQNIIRTEKHDERVRVYKQRQLLALSALSMAIDVQDFIYLCDIDDPHVACIALEKKYLPQKAIHFNQYLDRLFTIPKAHDSASIAETMQTLTMLKSDLAALSVTSAATPGASTITPSVTTTTTKDEYKIPDAIFVHVLLRTLPDYYDPLRQTLVNSDTSLDFSNIVNRLKTQELHRAGATGASDHIAMLSGHRGGNASNPKAGDCIPPKGFDEGKGDGWVVGWHPKCGHCHKAGYVWVQCRARLSKDKKAPKSADHPTPPATISTNTELPLAGQADESVESPPFILSIKDHSASISSALTLPAGSFHVDSASTAHMEPELSRFSHYTKLHEPIRVTLADEHVVLAPGWGRVKLTLWYGDSLTVHDLEFLHVPDLRCTLISVSTLASMLY